MTPTQQLLSQQFPHLEFQFDFALSQITYFKIGGPAEVFLNATSIDQIVEVVSFCRQQQIPFHILGGASNVVVADEGLPGLVVVTAHESYQILPNQLPDGRRLIRVDSGYKTALFVRRTIDDGFQGLEFFLGVPGKLGGAIFNNAHYLSDLVGQHIYRVQVLTSDNRQIWLSAEECDFGYDHSRFQTSGEAILQAEFALELGDKPASLAKVTEATRYRATTQPLGEPSSGCIFQNAPNTEALRQQFPQFADKAYVPGGFLIDQAGLKGTRVGGIEVSHKHAAFFVNKGHGTAAQVAELVQLVKHQVKEKFGVELREEVFYLR